MALTPEEIVSIKNLVADPIDRGNREAMDRLEHQTTAAMQRLEIGSTTAMSRIEELLADHVREHNARLDGHDKRIASLEKLQGKALAAWSIIVMCVTFLGTYVWKTWIEPLVKGRGHS